MSTNMPNFDKAEYVSEPPPQAVSVYTPLPSFAEPVTIDATHDTHAKFTRAILFGIPAALIGCCIYAGITVLTHFTIGYFGLFLGFLIATVMMKGSDGIGGRRYQIAAAILTYLSIAMASVPTYLWQSTSQPKSFAHSLLAFIILLVIGAISPFIELAGDFFHGAIGLVIIFVGIRGAWRVAAGKHPAA